MADLSSIPLEKLEAEIRRRKVEAPCLGVLTIKDSGKSAEFGLITVPWPDGQYKIEIKCLEDLTVDQAIQKDYNDANPEESTTNHESDK